MTLAERARRWLEGPRLDWALAVIAALLVSPSLFAGLATEDYVFRAHTRFPFSFRYVNMYGGPEIEGAAAFAQKLGISPWIGSPSLHLSFWRPLSSLTHHIDYRLFGEAFAWMHAESILAYAALVLVTARLYRRLIGPSWVGGLAALFYAVDDAHGHAVGWLANRNGILAALFGLSALLAHTSWRKEGSRVGAALAPICLLLALLSGELGLGALAYFVAYALFVEPGSWRRRALSLAPATAVTLAWAIAYRAFGHGARGSGIYLDPWRDPLELASALPDRLGALIVGQLALPPSDSWVALGDRAHLPLALGGLALVILLALALGRRAPSYVAFFALGGFGALLPLAATFPSDRLLFLAGFGAFGVLAALGERATSSRPVRVAFVAAIVLHAIVAPLLLPLRSLSMARLHSRVMTTTRSVYAHAPSMDDVPILVNAPDYYVCSLLRLMRGYVDAMSAPNAVCLAGSFAPVELRRADTNAIEVRSSSGFLDRPFNRIYRSRNEPSRVGDRIFLGKVEAEVTEVDAKGEARAAVFRFAWDLDNERLHFLVYRSGRYEPLELPQRGTTRIVSGEPPTLVDAWSLR